MSLPRYQGGTASNDGLRIIDSGPQIHSSSFTGVGTGATGLHNGSDGSQTTNTRIVGGVSNDSQIVNCRDNYDENLVDVDC